MADVFLNSVIIVSLASGGGGIVQEVRNFKGAVAMNDCKRYEQQIHGATFSHVENGKNVSRIVSPAHNGREKTTETITFCWEL